VSQDDPGTSSRYDAFDAADRGESAGFFRGAEFGRLLVLAVIMVVGWALVWKYMHPAVAPPDEPAPAVRAALPRAEPDRSPEFETVTDWTPIGLRDMAAYELLLKRARETGPGNLARQGRRDTLYTDLWERPERYRGVPIHLLGTAWRIHSYESKLSPTGRIHEAWIGTHESQNNPYVCVFEDLPKGMPVGPDAVERVVFNGYFLKEMRYLSGNDVKRGAPVLIGAIGWTPARSARRDDSVFWMAAIVAVMFLISLSRWIIGLRRSLSRPSLARSLLRRPNEEIAPEDLSQWVDSVQEAEREPEGEGEGEGERGREDDRR
jgi:hypothetical protein